MRKHKRVVREKQSRDVDNGIGELKASLVHVRAPLGICSWSPSLLWSRPWSHHYGSHQVDEDLAIKAMLTTSCTGHLDVIFAMDLPRKKGSPRPPNTVAIASPYQTRRSMTSRRVTRTPMRRHTKIIVVVHSRTKHKLATPFSLTLPRPKLALALSKFVLKPLNVITRH